MRSRISNLACAALTVVAVLHAAPQSAAAVPRSFTQEPVPGAPSTDSKRPATIEAVRFGFDGFVPSDAWSPIRVYLSGNPAINTGAFAGTVTIDFTQDATQSASITTNIATTPGRVIPVEVIAAIPRATPSVRVQLRDQAGRIVDEREYWQAQFGQAPLPASIVSDVQLIVAIADRSGAQPSIARALKQPEQVREDREPAGPDDADKARIDDRLASCVIREDELPMSEFGFGGVTAVAARSDVLASLSPQKLKALVAWIESGGCLIVLAGAEPQTWVREFWDQPPIAVLDSASIERGPDLVPLAARQDARATLTGRVIRLAQPIAESGWRVDWTTTTVNRQDGKLMDGLLAQGPAGFGWIVVLGIDPASLGTTTAQLTRTWIESLDHALAEVAARPLLKANNFWHARGSGPDASSRLAIKASLDSMTDVPALGDGAFIAIVVFLVLLAVAIGPLDALVLRHVKLRAWSWATALGWIAIASALAAVVPPLIRTGDSTLRRLRVVDALQPADRPVLARQTAITSLFANALSNVVVSDPGHEKEEPVGWFRGISASYLDDYGRSQPLSSFATFQSETRIENGRSARNNAPIRQWPLSMGQWTLRSFMSARTDPQLPVPTVSLARVDGAWVVRVDGLTGKKAEGSLRIGSQRLELASRQISNGASVEFQAGKQLGTSEHRKPRSARHPDIDDFEYEEMFSPQTLFDIPGIRERSRAVDALVASGGWACVYLQETGNTPTLDARATGDTANFAATESTLWRILVPLDPADRFKPLPLAGASVGATPVPATKGTP
ncbi:MAG: hypothetical protein KF805_09280 [Phycisphaeraceae bacterium]|nr:hypothetical protein [Phycisphaeraceae bacterium]